VGRFETSLDHSSRWHQPVRVPVAKGDVYGAAKEMVEDLDGWVVQSTDDETLTIACVKKGGLLGGTANIVVRIEGPDGIPNSETHCSSESTSGLLSRDKGNVTEFVKKFWMRMT
jgi:hypothetical protein